MTRPYQGRLDPNGADYAADPLESPGHTHVPADIPGSGFLEAAKNLSDVGNTVTSLANLGGVGSASPAFTGTPTAPTAAALTDNTQLSTTAYADSAVSVEKTRAVAAEALKVAKAGDSMTGALAMGTNKITVLGNGTAPTDAAAFGQIPTALPPNGAASGDLTGTYPGPTLAASGVTAATVGSATAIPVITVDAKGRLTATSTAAPSDTTRVAKAGDTMTGQLVVPDLSVTGLTGAVAASRYVGATTSGAPTTGTFAIGDFSIDQTGFIYICTVAGTPGTWVKVGGSSALTILSVATLTSVALPVNVVMIVGTTASLAVGTWQLIATLQIYAASALVSIASPVVNLSLGTATATFSATNGPVDAFPATNAGGAGAGKNLTLAEFITVTVAGTINITVNWNTAGTIAGSTNGNYCNYILTKVV